MTVEVNQQNKKTAEGSPYKFAEIAVGSKKEYYMRVFDKISQGNIFTFNPRKITINYFG